MRRLEGGKSDLQLTLVIEEPAGPPKRLFYQEIVDPLERQKLCDSLSDSQKSYQQAAYELYVTEIDYVRDLKITAEVFIFLFFILLFFYIYFYFTNKLFFKNKKIFHDAMGVNFPDLVMPIFTEQFKSLVEVHEV